jgi:hypothetical protein
MTHEQYYEEKVFEEEYYEQEYNDPDEEYRDDRCTYEQRWWDYSYYQDARFL